mgnify:CR=1 FL=1
MTKRKQCAALALALTLTISMFGCEKDKETTQSSAVSQIKTSDSAQPSNVKVKKYKFPEFLNKIKSLDELSRKLYTSFDSTQVFGIGSQIFSIGGPVILYGIFTSWLLGLVYWIWKIVQ